jgi:uncharacterized protein YkwD
MGRWAAIAAAAAVVCGVAPATAAACTGVDDAPSAGNVAAIGDTTLCLLNAERAQRGLGALTANGQLARAAEGHNSEMVRSQFFSHDSPDGRSFEDRILAAGYRPLGAGGWTVGENIAWGTGELATPRSIMAAWMASPGHRANILESGFQEIGVAVAPGTPASDAGGATYTTDFGARDQPVRVRAQRHRKVRKRAHKRARAQGRHHRARR